jgi:hypothetical protein
MVLSLLPAAVSAESTTSSTTSSKETIESALNLANNADQEWSYDSSADAWVLSVVSAVVSPVLPDQEGVSISTPGTYVKGIDTNADGAADVTAATYSSAVKGSLVIDYDATVTSTNGQTYTAATAPVIFTTGAAGYGSQNNQTASTSYAKEGYIGMACGNRGKQDAVKDDSGNVLYYTGDAPSCLADQKAATRYVKYNILLGNLPGSVDYFVSTGGSGGAAHAAMFAATSNNPDFYDYQIAVGAVGVYKNEDGSYSTAVTIDGKDVEISDGAWGTIAYSAITPLYEGDAAQAFEYYMDTTYDFNTPFQKQLAAYLSEAYMNYINSKNLSVKESDVGFDLNQDGDKDDTIPLTISYDLDAHPETNGYYGTYLDLYLAEFQSNLQWYLDNLDYAEGWTWFDKDGSAMTDEAVAAMTSVDKAQAFIEGRYTKAAVASGGPGGMGGPGGAMGGTPPQGTTGTTDGTGTDSAQAQFGQDVRSGGPTSGTSASSGSGTDSSNYATFEDMAAAYASDIAEIEAGDAYGNNLVSLYNPLNYIGAEGTANPTWTRIVMGAVEGDMPMMAPLNLEIAWLNAGVDADIEWQWDGGHVPNEVLGSSLPLYVDEMYGKYVSNKETVKPAATALTENGTETEASGKDLSGWVKYDNVTNVSFTLADVLAYRNSGASKAVPGFDTIDYGQEDYVFGSAEKDARHWDVFVNGIFQNAEYAKVLASLFNTGTTGSADSTGSAG